MNAFNTTSPSDWLTRQPVRSQHAIFRDKERRRERIRANIVAQARKGGRWAAASDAMTTLAMR